VHVSHDFRKKTIILQSKWMSTLITFPYKTRQDKIILLMSNECKKSISHVNTKLECKKERGDSCQVVNQMRFHVVQSPQENFTIIMQPISDVLHVMERQRERNTCVGHNQLVNQMHFY